MKIWWQSSTPIHRLDDYRNTLTKNLNELKRSDVEIHINGVDDGSMDLHYNAVVAVNNFGPGGVLNKIMQAADQGYDAVAIGCFLDPAMQEAREVVSIPVIGATLGGENVYNTKKMQAGVLVIGNESKGISDKVLKVVNRQVMIPRRGGAESLNAGVSAGILCALLMGDNG